MKTKEPPHQNLTLYLNVFKEEHGGFCMTFYSPYWIVNKSDLSLIYAEGTMFMSKKSIQESIPVDLEEPEKEADEVSDEGPEEEEVTELQKLETINSSSLQIPTLSPFAKSAPIFKADRTMYSCPKCKASVTASRNYNKDFDILTCSSCRFNF
jgi:hypothetical protein